MILILLVAATGMKGCDQDSARRQGSAGKEDDSSSTQVVSQAGLVETMYVPEAERKITTPSFYYDPTNGTVSGVGAWPVKQ